MNTDTSTLVPPRRLGTLLRRHRVAAGLDLNELAFRSELTVVDLEDVEQGRRTINDSLLSHLITLYGIEDAGLVPERSLLVIDLDEGRIAVDHSDVVAAGSTGTDAVLARYLALVYRLRGLSLGTSIPLRDIDLEVLSTALHIETEEIETRLRRLMHDEDEIATDQRRIQRRLLLPLVGVVIAASATGVLVLVAEQDPAPDVVQETTGTVADTGAARISTGAVASSTGVETDLGNGAAVADAPESATDLGSGAVVVENP